MGRLLPALVLVLSFLTSPASAPGQAESALPPAQAALAVRSLQRTALTLVHGPSSSNRASRLIALMNMAQRLAPEDTLTNQLLAYIGRSRSQSPDEALRLEAKMAEEAAVLVQMRANRDDYAKALQWVYLRLELIQTAEQRLKFLDEVIADPYFPQTVKAVAHAERSRIYDAQGDLPSAMAAVNEALKLDPYLSLALERRFQLRGKDAIEQDKREKAVIGIGVLSGNPFSETAPHEMGAWMGHLGLHSEALQFLGHVLAMVKKHPVLPPGVAAPVARYMNAMLDMELYADAVQSFPAIMERFGADPAMKWLLVEAYRGAGRQQEADDLLESIRAEYEALRPTDAQSSNLAMELAWFYTFWLRRPDQAVSLLSAWMAAASADDLTAQRIIGAAEISSSSGDLVSAGVRRLGRLVDKDTFAAAFLARHYFAQGNAGAGKAAIEAGAKVTRGGAGFRFLREIARQNNVQISPTLSGAADVAEVVKGFDTRYLEMAVSPEKYLSVTITPVADVVPFQSAIEIQATIANTGSLAVPLVQPSGGALQPQMSINAEVTGADQMPISFDELPVVVWPAPRYLQPGRSVSATVRLDVAKLEEYLFTHPFDDLELTVRGILSPRQYERGGEFFSGVPGLAIAPAKITRQGLFSTFGLAGEDPAKAYSSSLGYIVRDIQLGEPAQRMRAARQTAALLGLLRNAERARAKLPDALVPIVSKGVLLRMVQEVMKDPAPVVRAELLAALGRVKLDGSILRLLGPAVDDPNPLVRFRMAETLGTSGTPGHQTIVDYLAGDSDEIVKAMAVAVQTKSPTRRGAAAE